MGEREKEILKLVCLPLKDLAEAIGVSYSKLRNWSVGRTQIPDAHRTALVRFIRRHAKRLEKAADALENKPE